MNNSTAKGPDWGHIVSVHRGDRWAIHRRMQELNIPCACPDDGTLRVDVNHPIALLLVHSVVRQIRASRQETMAWLERCWETQEVCTTVH